MGGRIDVEANDIDIFEFLGELRVRRQLERCGCDAARVGGPRGYVAPNAGSPLRPSPAAGRSSGLLLPAPARAPDQPLSARLPVGSGCLPGLRVLSRVSPSTPSAINRACHLHTTGFDLPERRMISAVPQPSAVARMMLARHTCFCGALRSETIASSRSRSARVTFTTIPALIPRA